MTIFDLPKTDHEKKVLKDFYKNETSYAHRFDNQVLITIDSSRPDFFEGVPLNSEEKYKNKKFQCINNLLEKYPESSRYYNSNVE